MNELVRLNPFRALAPFDDSAFNVLPALFQPVARAAGWSGPRMDIAEVDGAYRLAVEMPGVKKENIQVTVHENSVTISGETTAEAEQEGTSWLLRERSFGKFSRTVSLPEAVDEDAAEARFADGVLYLTLKQKSATRARRISIH
jgi:HSP20 family protein